MFSSSIRQCRNALFLSMPLLGGCVTAPPFNPVCTEVLITPAPMALVSTLQQGRYTVVEMRPDPSQQDLKQQIINLRIHASATTVGDAMRHVLRHSGYRLCDGDPALATLWALPLPAAHLQLGPLPLNQTLQLLAGSASRLSVDERARQVCFMDGEARP